MYIHPTQNSETSAFQLFRGQFYALTVTLELCC